jgi:signal transduction histidine kinase
MTTTEPTDAESIRRDIEAIGRISSVPTILRVISETTGLRLSLIARVTASTWTACAVNDRMNFGLEPGGTLDVATTLCAKVRDTHAPVAIDHASQDPDYCDHPTPKMYGFESYISVPIFLPDGAYFGNVCALDPKPSQVKQDRIGTMMKLFAELIASQLAAESHQAVTRAELLDAQQTAVLREEFMAVLGHDLRNPLSSILIGAETLLRRPVDDGARKTVERIRSSGRRMSELVSNLLDFARSRLGSGIGLSLSEVADLGPSLGHVVSELESSYPGRKISFSIAGGGAVRCDPARVAQLLSNLLANALDHGSADGAVEVRVVQSSGRLGLSVHNEGAQIPPSILPRLFKPYSRGGHASQNGLGLGLYIANQIAKAHGGSLEVRSTAEDGTTFTFSLPGAGDAGPAAS